MRLYLASTSPARLATLRAAGIEPVVVPSHVDEDAAVAAYEVTNGAVSAPVMVELLARAKASSVVDAAARSNTASPPEERSDESGMAPLDGFVLGGDSAFELDGVIYGKPHTAEVAKERWLLQRGRTGRLHSGHWLIDHRGGVPGLGVGAVSTASVTFASDISDDELDAYIATGEPLAVAGAFTIDSLGAGFITSVDGDPHAVVGLSLATVRSLLLGFGVAWPSLWNRSAG